MASKRKHIAIFTSDDTVWALPVWKKTIPLLQTDHDVIGVYRFPSHLSYVRTRDIPVWYLKTFGLKVTAILGLFALKRRVELLISKCSSWTSLARTYHIQCQRSESPNDPQVVQWCKQNDIDIILIMVDSILKSEVIGCAHLGVINKHAAILPQCRGLFPYFWARMHNVPLGVTVHEVDTDIDSGRILEQVTYPFEGASVSMLRFYMDVYHVFPDLMTRAVDRLVRREYPGPLTQGVPTYYGLPTQEDYRAFRAKGFQMCTASDLFYQPAWQMKEIVEIRSH